MHILSICICRMTLPTNIKIRQTKDVHEKHNYKKKKYTETFGHINEYKTQDNITEKHIGIVRYVACKICERLITNGQIAAITEGMFYIFYTT